MQMYYNELVLNPQNLKRSNSITLAIALECKEDKVKVISD